MKLSERQKGWQEAIAFIRHVQDLNTNPLQKVTLAIVADNMQAKVGLPKRRQKAKASTTNAPNNAPLSSVEDVEQGLSVDDRCDFGGDAVGE